MATKKATTKAKAKTKTDNNTEYVEIPFPEFRFSEALLNEIYAEGKKPVSRLVEMFNDSTAVEETNTESLSICNVTLMDGTEHTMIQTVGTGSMFEIQNLNDVQGVLNYIVRNCTKALCYLMYTSLSECYSSPEDKWFSISE